MKIKISDKYCIIHVCVYIYHESIYIIKVYISSKYKEPIIYSCLYAKRAKIIIILGYKIRNFLKAV